MSEQTQRQATLKVYRGDKEKGDYQTYQVPVEAGMVVLDAIHYIQQNYDPELAVRWNCKAAKCGSCSAEVNGMPSLMCKSRMDQFDIGEEIKVQPLKTFPIIKDLVTDVSWNYEVNKKIKPFSPAADADWTIYQEDIERVQEFRKCIECFLCQNVCHVLRDDERKDQFMGPRFPSSAPRASKCIHWTKPIASNFSRTKDTSATATSQSAVLKSARKTSTSPTMPLFRLKNVS